MGINDGVTRREFVTTATGAAVGAIVAGQASGAAQAKRRYAIVGTGVRGIGMWGRPIVRDYKDIVEFVGLCDINPLRVEAAKAQIGVSCPTFTNYDEMLDKAKPDLVMITTVDAFHSQYLVRTLERGIDVMTEKPMVIDETQCRAVLDAEKKSGRKIVVTHNYRYAPKHQKIKELLMGGEIGKITSVDFTWFLDTTHGADYFRRWHRLRSKSGSLWVHKATHHFDLINWWLDADPVQVSAIGTLSNYGKAGPFRHTNCRSCPHKEKCPYYWDITTQKQLVDLYVKCESADGYQRDGCVFKEDIDIFDTMNAVVRYSNGINMSYSTNTFMPVEGYYLAFNGTKGRLEIRDYERQPWNPGVGTAMYLIKNFGTRTQIDFAEETEGHGGGDQRLRDLIFKKIDAPAHLRLPDSRAGALSCLTGIAARKSCDEGRPIKIADLVPGLGVRA
ncbi:MAG TPA: Gfo/Idh/MocA family oxidoreductase [Vicinamibacterales bacterium]|jgi:predicted dehydrogenase